MRRFAVRKWWRDGGLTVVAALCAGRVLAGTPPNVEIRTPAEAQAFAESAPFVFRGQHLNVHTSFSTDAEIQLEDWARIRVAEGARFEMQGRVVPAADRMAAGLEKTGLGTLALYGDNRYTQVTRLYEGTLEVGGTSPLGEEGFTVHQLAGTALHFVDGAEVSNSIQVAPAQSGYRPLPGLEKKVEWRVDAGEARIGLRPSVSGDVTVHKTGVGTLHIMRGFGNHAPFRVDEGVLRVDGFMSAYVDVGAGARLDGAGELFDLHIRGGGMVAPAGRDAAGTLSVLTDLRFDPGAIYHVNAHADGQADLLRVGGVALLDGEVQVMAGAGEWAPEQQYTILSALGGLNDSRFAEATTNLAFLEPELSYDANNVYLALQRNDLNIGDVGDTPDDRDVGDVIDPPVIPDPDGASDPATPPGPPGPPTPTPEDPAPEDPMPEDPMPEDPMPEDPTPEGPAPEDPTPEVPTPEDPLPEEPSPVVEDPTPEDPLPEDPATALQEEILTMDIDDARMALKQLSGSWHASVRSFLLEEGRYVREAVLANSHGSNSLRESARSWGEFYGANGRRGSRNGVAGDRHDTHGFVVGWNAPVGHAWRLGGVLAGQQARLRRDGHQASASVDSIHAGLTAQGEWDSMRVVTGLLHAWHRIESKRRLSAGSLQDRLMSTYGGRSWQVFTEILPQLKSLADWRRSLRGVNTGPYLRHTWAMLNTPSFEEGDGLGAHEVRGARHSMHATTLGWRHAHEGSWKGTPYRLEADLGWRHVWRGTRIESTQRFRASADTAASDWFTSRGLPLVRDAAHIGMGAGLALSKNASLSLRYSGLLGPAYRDHAAWANLRWRF